jgi:hypothetical protein
MIKQVTSAAAATRLLKIGPSCKMLAIQNNGSVDVRLSFDGGSDMPTVAGWSTGTLPTTALGYLLKAGQQWVQTKAQFPSIADKNIWGISAGGAIVLDIITDDKDSV